MSNVPAKRLPDDGTIRPTRLPEVGPADIYQALLVDSACENTRRSRVDVIKTLCAFLGEPDPRAACAMILTGGRSQAEAVVSSFRQHLIRARRSGATVNNRLACLRRLIELANRHELITWRIAVSDLKVKQYRNTIGPTQAQWNLLWQAAVDAGNGAMAVRNRAIVRLLRDVGLRKAECIGLDVADLDLEGGRVAITSKGYSTSAEWVKISDKCVALLTEWMARRGSFAGPVFISRPERLGDKARREELKRRGLELRASGLPAHTIAAVFNAEGLTTLTGRTWTVDRIEELFLDRRGGRPAIRRIPLRECNRIVYALSEAAGLGRTVRPHSLRHHSVTRILQLTNGNLVMAQRFARHADPRVTMIYADNLEDVHGKCVMLLGNDD